MVKFEIVYSGAGTKINLSDGRTLKLKDGQKFLMPIQDWEKTFKNSDNFSLAGGDIKKEEKEETKIEKPKKRRTYTRKGGK